MKYFLSIEVIIIKDELVSKVTSLVSIVASFNLLDAERIVTLIVGLISGLFSIAFTLYKWYKAAKKDGKITVDELETLDEYLKKVGKKK